jgi:hypothetical protein
MSEMGEAEDVAPANEEPEGLLDRLRGSGVGVEDPNIVGDVGPTDVPPGRDGIGDGLLAEPPEERDEGGATT